MYIIDEKTNVMYEAVDRFTTELKNTYDRGAFELPDEYEDLTAEDIVKMASSVDRETFVNTCRENLRQNAEMTVKLLTETMEQVQGVYDGLDEDNRRQFVHTMTIGVEAAVKIWEENADMFKELIGELPEDQRRALVNNSAANVAYLRSVIVPPCIKRWQNSLAGMWETVHKLAT